VTWVGTSLLRRENPRLLTGRGQFLDDLQIENTLHVALVRSPYAHARIRGVDVSGALAAPGVVGTLTGQEVAARSDPFQAGVVHEIGYYCMAVDRARYAGEPVAAVIADNRYLAEDAAELVVVEYEPLEPVVTVEDGLAASKPPLHDSMDSNVVVHRNLRYGDPDAAFAEADVVVTDTVRWERYSSTPVETFGVVADWDAVTEQLTVWANFMGPMTLATIVARSLRLRESQLRVIAPRDIGGSFGIKCSIFPYMTLVGLLATIVDRPVKWIEDRAEHLIGSAHQPDRLATRELALKRDGTILGYRARIVDNLGAYVRAPEPATTFMPVGNHVGGYRTQNVALELIDVLTNRVPSGPNRGYGRHQIYLEQERVLDLAARELALDPAEIRRRNLIPAGSFPYHAPTGAVYDSGDYPRVFERVLELADYDALRALQRHARAEGRLVGIGLSTAVDSSVSNMGYITVALPPEVRARPGYLPKSGAMDWAQVRLAPSGQAVVTMGTMPQGQGHETAMAQIVADDLTISPEDVVTVDEFDSHRSVWSISTGTYASRFASVATSALKKASGSVREQVLRIGAQMLEAAVEDVALVDGAVRAKDSPERAIPLKRIAGRAHWNTEGLDTAGIQASEVFSFDFSAPPTLDDRVNGLHTYGFISEVVAVEIDRGTWKPRILAYASVQDAGTIINPKIVEGLVYGGALHGLGGALLEEFCYDEDGQFVSGSFADYRCLSAVEAPKIAIDHIETPSPLTALGSKGAAEASAMSVPAAVANAIADALEPLGVRPSHLPMTPMRLWELTRT
jgi:2-furoyl-CoA dehydrogenase large subunit